MIQFTFFLRQVTLRPQRGPTFWDQLPWDQLLIHRRLSIITSRMSCTYVKPGRGAKDTPTIFWIWTRIGHRYPEQGRPKNRLALTIRSPVLGRDPKRDPGAGASEKQPRSIRHSSVFFQHHSLFKCIILVILSSYAIRSTAGATTIDGVRR